MRKPYLKPPELVAPRSREIIHLKVRLVTPMIGGGAVAQRVDDSYPVRATAIRGCLRHWWRAAVGHAYESATQMRSAEAALFGAASGDEGQPGKVGVRVVAVRNFKASTLGDIAEAVPPYAIGLFTPRSILDQIECVKEAEFDIEVACPTASVEHVRLAIDCWLAFGGLGARSRRGVGSLELLDQSMTVPRVAQSSREVAANEFSLANAQVLYGNPADVHQSWFRSVAAYASFRKGERPGVTRPNTGSNSHTPWPEADDYRVNKGTSPLRERGSKRGVIRAPRAALGLPLQLRSLPAHSGSFGKLDLSGTEDRLASSIITKPIQLEGKWHPGMIIVHRPVRLPKIPGLEVTTRGAPIGFFDGSKYDPLPREFDSASELLAFYLGEYAKWEEVPLR
jgi:CRISPR-associated protein Cmr1